MCYKFSHIHTHTVLFFFILRLSPVYFMNIFLLQGTNRGIYTLHSLQCFSIGCASEWKLAFFLLLNSLFILLSIKELEKRPEIYYRYAAFKAIK